MNANENTSEDASEDTSEDTRPAPAPDAKQEPEQEPELPPYSIEPARSSRSSAALAGARSRRASCASECCSRAPTVRATSGTT